jgi:hypothetical protein
MMPVSRVGGIPSSHPSMRRNALIPAVLRNCIYPFFRQGELGVAAQTCREFHQVATCPEFAYHHRVIDSRKIDLEEPCYVSDRITSVKIVGDDISAPKMDRLLNMYPRLNSIDLGECHDVYFPVIGCLARRLAGRKMVKLVLYVPTSAAWADQKTSDIAYKLLQSIDWTELVHLDYAGGKLLELHDWLVEKIQTAFHLRVLELHLETRSLPLYIRNIPPSVENLRLGYFPEAAVEDVIRKLGVQRFTSIRFYIGGCEPAAQSRLLQAVLPQIPHLKSLKIAGGVFNDAELESVCEKLRENQVLEEFNFSTDIRVLDALPRGSLREVWAYGDDLRTEEEKIFTFRSLLRFPKTVRLLGYNRGKILDLYIQRKAILAEADSPLKTAKLDILNHVPKERILADYGRPIGELDRYREISSSELIRLLER